MSPWQPCGYDSNLRDTTPRVPRLVAFAPKLLANVLPVRPQLADHHWAGPAPVGPSVSDVGGKAGGGWRSGSRIAMAGS